MPALAQPDELRPDLARHSLANAPVLLDIGPFPDQIEMIRITGVAAEHAVLDLLVRTVEGVVVAVIELVKQLDEFVAPAGLYPEIVDMKIILNPALGGCAEWPNGGLGRYGNRSKRVDRSPCG